MLGLEGGGALCLHTLSGKGSDEDQQEDDNPAAGIP